MGDRVAVVTGAAGGMGVASARRLAPSYRVLLADVDGDRLDEARSALQREGIESDIHVVDVSMAAPVAELADHAARLGDFGALVHTAGISPSMADGRRIWEINLVGTARLMAAFGPLAQDGSVAVLIASQAGHLLPDASQLDGLLDTALSDDFLDRVEAQDPALLDNVMAYSGSKYGVIRLAERAAGRWGAAGARVVSLSPGIIDTPMARRELDGQPFMATMIEKTPLRRMGTDDEIATAVAFLCSPAASFITGTDLLVDGGATRALQAGS